MELDAVYMSSTLLPLAPALPNMRRSKYGLTPNGQVSAPSGLQAYQIEQDTIEEEVKYWKR
jgi:hypothetical protein